MILYIDENRRITSYNETLAPEAAAAEIAKGTAAYFDGDFDFFMGEDKPGMQKSFYLNEDSTIRIEYIDAIKESQPLSEQEQIAIDTALTVEYMACLMEASLT